MDTDIVKNCIKSFIEHMGFGDFLDSIDMHQGMAKRFCIRMNNDANMLIGERGNNLVAMEHLIKKMVKKESLEEENFSLDINDYRVKKLEDLKQDVKSAAHEVRLYKKPVPLRPMSSFERRIIHMLLAEYPDITTESIGDEPERRVVIKPLP
ncbi:MAG: R3H domain-containing nucleic acid-binding protein [Patescibacteria group bacterium]